MYWWYKFKEWKTQLHPRTQSEVFILYKQWYKWPILKHILSSWPSRVLSLLPPQVWTQGGIHVLHERVPGDGMGLHAAVPLRDFQHGRRRKRRRVRGLHRPRQRAVHAPQLTMGSHGPAQQGKRENMTAPLEREINMIFLEVSSGKRAPAVSITHGHRMNIIWTPLELRLVF